MKRTRIFQGFAAALVAMALAVTAQADPRTDLFTVSVPVDQTAASAAAAQNAARIQGEQDAYNQLLSKLTLPRDRSRLAPPTQSTLNSVIQGFEVADEHHSDVRYLATLTFHFRPDAVEQVLRNHGVSFAETISKPVLVLPVLENAGRPMLWDDPNPWREAWSQARLSQGLVPLQVPLGEVEDVSAIDAANADAGDDAHLRAIAANYNNADVLVTRATIHQAQAGQSQEGESVDVSSTRFVPGSPGGEQSWVASYTANPGESEPDFLARAVAGTAAQVEDAWKQANMLDYSQSGTLVATVPAEDLGAWIAVRQRLAATSAVQRADVLSLDRHSVRVQLHYVGTADQLRVALAQNNLDLSGSDPNWILQRQGVAAAGETSTQ